MLRIKGILLTFSLVLFAACTTTKDLEKNIPENESESSFSSVEIEQQMNEAELNGLLIKEELKVQDVENTVVFVERPVYVPEEKQEKKEILKGYDAAVKSITEATISPEQYRYGTFYYQFNENLVYEIYAQPYHLTDIILEPGEIVKSPPLLSEDESVWELTAGVATDPITGRDIQHLFIKPAYHNLISSMIIITDRRVYHFLLKSYKTTYMAMVKFTYPGFRNVWAKADVKDSSQGRYIEDGYIRVSNPEFLSFDYKMKYSKFKKPDFLPTRVYDDGQQTYIQVNDIVLQKKLPVIFSKKNEIINYLVKKNTFVIPSLIDRVTLRLGKEKVVIEKKISKVSTGKNEN